MNFNTFEKLQYKELKELIKEYCISNLGKELIDKLEPSSNIELVRKRLNDTTEARKILDMHSYVPLEGIKDINNIIVKVEKGLVLDPEELINIYDFLRGCRKIKSFMKTKESYVKEIVLYSNSISEMKYIEDGIEESIRGNRVDSNASKELKKIRKNIELTQSKIGEKLDKFLKNPSNKKYIQEFFVSKRNDRYTIPIKSSYKNYVDGSIVEISSKGTTVFIEPSSVGKYTAELTVLKAEESIEEYKVLAELTELVYQKIKELKINIEVVAEYDMIFAKAKYSKSIDGIEPKINDYGYTKLVKGVHPLLKGNIVPLDFEVGKNYRSLIITGPNAGGKTVVLKTIGILTLAVQSGFHIKAMEGTEISIFEKIFVDIGDNQSLENALSTFSSHVKNIAEIMKISNKSTMLLFDEIGSGTEPNEGAALAIAILEEFYKMGCITIATTHYGEIKEFSEQHSDFENAAMQFKSDTLEPMYKLIIGKSGESNALWIAKKMGLKSNVLSKAKDYMEHKEYDVSRVDISKVRKEKEKNTVKENEYEFKKGDKVLITESNEYALVYEPKDEFNKIKLFYNNQFIDVYYKKIKLELRAEELYPEGYDLDTLFTSYKERKLEHDIQRGSKKALKKILKNK